MNVQSYCRAIAQAAKLPNHIPELARCNDGICPRGIILHHITSMARKDEGLHDVDLLAVLNDAMRAHQL
jgi:hypothetical protein